MGLSARTHGVSGGAETHLLTAAQSGVPQHTHTYATRTTATNTKNPGDGQGSTATSTSNETGANTAAPAAEAHPNMQPFLALHYIVRYFAGVV
jgi:microcystin-dependent protein